MRAILGDVNVQGHVRVLVTILESEEWREVWAYLNLPLCTFRDLGLPPTIADADLWRACQQQEIILITANRNAAGPDSLEATLRAENTPKSLPVFTLASAERILQSRIYAQRVVEKFLVYLLDIDKIRGTGRLYLP